MPENRWKTGESAPRPRHHRRGHRSIGALLILAGALLLDLAGALLLDIPGTHAAGAASAGHPTPSAHRRTPASPTATVSPFTGGWRRLSVDAPQPTAGAALAWDSADRVMFVVDGASTGGALWAYRPVTTTAGAPGWLRLDAGGDTPGPLTGASAVWDDRDGVLLVLDGLQDGRETDGLYAYKPGRNVAVSRASHTAHASRKDAASGSWTAVDAPGAPLRRAYQSAVWDGADGAMIVVGGATGNILHGDTWLFKPGKGGQSAGTWTQLASSRSGGPPARQRAMAAWDSSDHAMIVAGGSGYDGLLSDIWMLRSTGRAFTWSRLAATTPLGPRAGGAALWDSAGKQFLVFGGQVTPPAPPTTTAVPPAPTPQTITPVATMVATATVASATTIPPAAAPTIVPSTPTTTISATGSAAAAPAAAALMTLADERAHSQATAGLTTGLAHSPGSAGVSPASSDGGRLAAGAPSRYTTGLVTAQSAYSDDLWAYAAGRRGISGGTWRLLRQHGGPLARAAGAVYDTTDRAILLFGGQGVVTLSDLWSYPLAGREAGRWTLLNGGQPQARAGQAGAWDARDGVLFIFGGYSGTRLNDLWAYKPARGAAGRWTLIPSFGPSPRTEASLVWDSADNVLLLFGGADASGALNDLWAYQPASDGTAAGRWIAFAGGPTAPSGRHLHAAVWDSANRQMLVYAGESGATVLRDLWSFHIDNLIRGQGRWRLLTAATTPAARFAQTAVWDPAGARMLVFGGVNTAGAFLDDLWAYAPDRRGGPGSWTSLGAPGTPDARATAAAAWDPVDNAMLLFGGTGDGSVRNDTYAYRPSSGWSSLARANPPGRRNGATAVYDTINHGLLLFGGTGASGAYNDLYQLGGLSPSSRGR